MKLKLNETLQLTISNPVVGEIAEVVLDLDHDTLMFQILDAEDGVPFRIHNLKTETLQEAAEDLLERSLVRILTDNAGIIEATVLDASYLNEHTLVLVLRVKRWTDVPVNMGMKGGVFFFGGAYIRLMERAPLFRTSDGTAVDQSALVKWRHQVERLERMEQRVASAQAGLTAAMEELNNFLSES